MAVSDLCYIDDTGFHFPDYPTVLAMFQDDYRTIYGADVYIDPDSQDGQWIAVNALAIYEAMSLAASVYNAYSPSSAQGVGLSRNVKINGIRRRPATFSTVELTIVGQAFTEILDGQAQDILDQKWNLPASVIIPPGGEITVTATADEPGAVVAAAATVTKPATPTRGWQSVTNAAPAVVGIPEETDFELRRRQRVSTALPSKSVFEGTIGAVGNIEGVSRFKGYENDTNATDADGLPPHSIAIVVEGGDQVEIAEAIARHKTPGTYTHGSTSQIVYDQYGVPNTIRFFRPTLVPITAVITIKALTGYTTSYADIIKAAVAAAINAMEIGDDVLLTKLYVPANLPGTPQYGTFDIVTIEISRPPGPPAAANVTIAFNEAATCMVADITVTVVP